MSSVGMEPGAVAAQLQRAVALHQRGELSHAQAIYERILAVHPRHFDALHMLGVIAAMAGKPREALAWMDRAIDVDPRNAVALNNRGLAHQELEEFEAALGDHERALAVEPRYGEAHFARGNALKGLGRWQEALLSYRRAIAARADHAPAFCNCGVVLMEMKRWEAALACFDRALTIKPDFAEAYNNRGNVLCEQKHWQAALESYDRALALEPGYAAAHCNRAVALYESMRWEEALASCDRAIALEPHYAEAYTNRGGVLRSLQRLDAAIGSFDRAIALKPDLITAHVNRSMALLLAGDFERGWLGYEWRWRGASGWCTSDRRSFPQPSWLGETSIAGKTLLVYAEQGLGDTIQFCRYAKELSALGARVILEVPHILVSLLSGLEGTAQVLARGAPLPEFDLHCPMLSLPLACGTTLSSIPAQTPYLRSSPERSRRWRDRLGPRHAPRVGIAWSGGFRPDQPELWAANDRRNIPLMALAPLEHPGIEFYSLQKGQPAESMLAELVERGWHGPALRDFAAELDDLAETAALIEQLDLVISVDTSIAHLAGALGKPVWILNRYDTCWRWLLERSDSPWYPAARIYRQPRPGDWDAVVESVRQDLRRWLCASA
ncbi:MAG TPA: tetratricopeptide repeat-containing glycosyltransferase family protein [Steroidobacteraceae bacterium]|nr:tetratricopeptide repeat-containing glycosyltransferase family protein [Steroidobacteraceae bacterium]